MGTVLPGAALGSQATNLGIDGRVALVLGATKGIGRAIGHFRDKPVRISWGMKDLLFGDEVLDCWRDLLPAAEVLQLPAASHFVQEDAPAEVRAALVEFVGPFIRP